MEWVESTGDTLEIAKEDALDRLGVHEDDAEFDVVADVRTGLFGRIKEPARVRARVRPATPRSKDRHRRDRSNKRNRGSQSNRGSSSRRASQTERRSADRPRRSQTNSGNEGKSGGDKKSSGAKEARAHPPDRHTEQDQARAEKSQAPPKPKKKADIVNEDEEMMPLPEQADIAEKFVRGLAQRFGIDAHFQRENVKPDEIRITVSGDGIGPMVGRRGITAGAIDDLVRTVLQRRAGSARNGRVRVDVGGVVARRNDALVRFARSQAGEVQASGVPRSLEPMNAADRKLVHDAVDGTEGVRTISEGDDPRRYVVILPA